MNLIGKIKMKLGLCVHTRCFRKATLDVQIPLIDYKGQLCEKCFKKLVSTGMFKPKKQDGGIEK